MTDANQELPVTTTPDTSAARRQVLRTTAAGAAAAFLAACTKARKEPKAKPGTSGDAHTTTSVKPTVPTTEPSKTALTLDQTVLRTATSLELVVSSAYADHGPDLQDATWKALAETYRGAHTDAAAVFAEATEPADKRIEKPNDWVQENLIDPVEDTLSGDAAILDLFHGLESMLAATYITAAGQFTTAEWRQKVMTYGAAAARRTGVLGNSGEGALPTGAVFPLSDLISNDAYLPVKKTKS